MLNYIRCYTKLHRISYKTLKFLQRLKTFELFFFLSRKTNESVDILSFVLFTTNGFFTLYKNVTFHN